MKRLFPLALLLMAGLPALAEGTATPEAGEEAEAAEPLPYVEATVNLNGVDYLAVIDISGEAPTKVNGEDMDLAAHVPGAVRIARADGGSMADEGYRAHEVLAEACAGQGMRADDSVVPVLSPAGRWIFAEGCK